MRMDSNPRLLTEAWRPTLESVQEGADGALLFEGVALVDNLLSKNGYFYSREFNDACLAATNQWMDEGNPVTMYSRHSKATGDFWGAGEGIPIGLAAEHLWREGNTIRYKGKVLPTAEGRDMQTLIRAGVTKPTSIRTYTFSAKPATMEGEEVMWLTDGRIEGIDFCERPGIEGAGVKRIFEEAPTYTGPEGEEDNAMDWSTITYAELVENRKDLLDKHLAESIATLLSERDAAREQVAELQARPPVEDTSKLEALEAEKASLARKLAVAEAAQGYVAGRVAAKLLESNVADEQLAEQAEAIRNEILNESVVERGGGEGRAAFASDADDPKPEPVKESMQHVLDPNEVDVDALLRLSAR